MDNSNSFGSSPDVLFEKRKTALDTSLDSNVLTQREYNKKLKRLNKEFKK